MLQTLSAAEVDEGITTTVYTYNGTESINLSCGEVPEQATSIEWYIDKLNEWQRILKFYHNKPDRPPEHYNSYSKDKYDISESVKTSLLVKKIDFTDTGLYKCRTRGGPLFYSYTTWLKVVGESLLLLIFQKKFNLYKNSFST